MALIKLGVAVAAIRGSIEGTTFSQNKAGAYMRNRSIPTNPNTVKQQNVRTALSQLTAYWGNTVTSAARSSWATLAEQTTFINKVGVSYHPSGFQLFIRNNMVIATGLTEPLADVEAGAPSRALAAQPAVVATISHTTGMSITAMENTGTTSKLLVYASDPVPGSQIYRSVPVKYVTSFDDFETLPLTIAGLAGGGAGMARFVGYRVLQSEVQSPNSRVSNMVITRIVLT